MNSIMLLVAALFLFVLILAFIRALSQREPSVWPFYPRKPLSAPEQILYFRLIKSLPEHIVLAQVQLSRFLGVKKGNNFQSWLNRINRMSADFVICNKDASVLAVIELDDASHNSKTRQQADAKKDKAIRSAGLRLIRWNVKTMPNEEAIIGQILRQE
jgi:very-short-patch-repair endonuclease